VCFRKDIDTKTFKFPEPQELKIFIKDILEKEVDSKYYLSEKLQERFKNYLEEKVHSLFPRSGKNGRGGTGHLTKNDGTTYALDTGNNQAVVANCLDSNMAKGVTPEMYYQKSHRNIVSTGKLRRLTPRECFRLQGFLNDEVNLEGLSDTQCYKLAGNGQSVNVVIKIFKEMFK
jgi:DNA (cytosine-5)-methyltransferase 1